MEGGWSPGDAMGGWVTRRGGARDWSPWTCSSGNWLLGDMAKRTSHRRYGMGLVTRGVGSGENWSPVDVGVSGH